MPTLVITNESGEIGRIDVHADPVTIGRLDDNDVVVEDPLVSRNHCILEPRGDDFVLVDLNSKYGTFVNNERVENERILALGDRVRIGTTHLSLGDFRTDGVVVEDGGGDAHEDTKPLVRATLSGINDTALELEEILAGATPDLEEARLLARVICERLYDAENALTELEQSQQLHRTLSEVGKLISAVTDLSQVIRLTMDLAITALGADRGFLLLRDDGGTLTPRATRNMDREVRALVRRGISQSIAGYVADKGKPVLTTDAQIDPRFKETESVMAHDIRAVMCVPLRNKSLATIGTIYVDGPPGSSFFSERGLNFLTTFAAQAAVAIENAQLIEKSRLEERLRDRLSRYFSSAVVEDILAGHEALETGGDNRIVTVLFTDIRGSTRILERIRPEHAVELLNDFFEEIVEEVLAEEGTLDKFTGDGFMAFWGAPKEQPDHAERAVRAALKMQEKLPALRNRWRIEKRPFAGETGGLQMGVGIHSGEVVVGNVGSPKRMEYTAIGDAVNVAARIQGRARGGEVLITTEVLDQVRDILTVDTLDPVTLKGKSEPIALYRVQSVKRRGG